MKQKLLFFSLFFLVSSYLFCIEESSDLQQDISVNQQEVGRNDKTLQEASSLVGLKSYTRGIVTNLIDEYLKNDAKKDISKLPQKTGKSFILTAGIGAGVAALCFACKKLISGSGGCCGGCCTGTCGGCH